MDTRLIVAFSRSLKHEGNYSDELTLERRLVILQKLWVPLEQSPPYNNTIPKTRNKLYRFPSSYEVKTMKI